MTQYKGGPVDGLTCCSGGDVVYHMTADNIGHRYQLDRGVYRYQGKRNVLKNGMDMHPSLRLCVECHKPREDYISTTCPYCGSKKYRRI